MSFPSSLKYPRLSPLQKFELLSSCRCSSGLERGLFVRIGEECPLIGGRVRLSRVKVSPQSHASFLVVCIWWCLAFRPCWIGHRTGKVKFNSIQFLKPPLILALGSPLATPLSLARNVLSSHKGRDCHTTRPSLLNFLKSTVFIDYVIMCDDIYDDGKQARL